MTRKRFVKLLMGRGYSRNGANAKAREVVAKRGVYAYEYYREFNVFETLARLTAPFSTIDLSGLNAALAEMAELAGKTCEKMEALFADFMGRLGRGKDG